MSRTVSSPDGNRWYVRRVWLPWRPKWRGRRKKPELRVNDRVEDAAGCLFDWDVLLVIVALLVAVFFAWPLLLALAELAVLGLLALLGVLARVILRRPWIVEATPATGPGRWRWKVVGWRRSGEVVELVAAQLGTGARSIHVPDAEAG